MAKIWNISPLARLVIPNYRRLFINLLIGKTKRTDYIIRCCECGNWIASGGMKDHVYNEHGLDWFIAIEEYQNYIGRVITKDQARVWSR